MDWVTLALVAAALWAVSNLLDKLLLEKWVKNPLVPANIVAIVCLMAGLTTLGVHGITLLSPINTLLALLGAGLATVAMIYYFKALAIEEVSRIVPLFNLGPLFILVLATIFLDEVFTPIKYVGILLLVLGSILIVIKKDISFGKAVPLMMVCLITSAFTQVIGKYLLGFADYWTVYTYRMLGQFLTLIPVMWISHKDLIADTRKHGKRVPAAMFASEIIAAIAFFIFTIAVSLGPVTLVNSLGALQPLFVLIVMILTSTFFPQILKEEIDKHTILMKALAIILLIVGGYLVA